MVVYRDDAERIYYYYLACCVVFFFLFFGGGGGRDGVAGTFCKAPSAVFPATRVASSQQAPAIALFESKTNRCRILHL